MATTWKDYVVTFYNKIQELDKFRISAPTPKSAVAKAERLGGYETKKTCIAYNDERWGTTYYTDIAYFNADVVDMAHPEVKHTFSIIPNLKKMSKRDRS